jgi:hypothetical protein
MFTVCLHGVRDGCMRRSEYMYVTLAETPGKVHSLGRLNPMIMITRLTNPAEYITNRRSPTSESRNAEQMHRVVYQ